ncbi:pyridoxamine 5'-phosphate oxidase family protein [Cupriavidus sp. 30B13]|uniref:pyridoxamine 5'-phosphate oxidase family protein n=1 Tax=Cupriavidus sp. 30B13 TaxID=3384241 RepID=UPI003B90DB0F
MPAKPSPDAVPVPAVLDASHAALLRRRVSVNAATRDAAGVPHLMRAVGYRVDADFRCVTLFLNRAQSRQLLADIEDNGAIAVVFSEPTTHHTLQLKGFDARAVPLRPDDPARVAAYRETLADEIAVLGFERALVYALLACTGDSLAAVAFTPSLAFRQTPGVHAGQALGGEAP